MKSIYLFSFILALISTSLAVRMPADVPPELLGVAVIFNGDISDFGFTYTLDQGRVAVQTYFGRDVVMTDYIGGIKLPTNLSQPSPECMAAVTYLSEHGYSLVVAPDLFASCLQWAHDQFPNMHFLVLSTSQPAKYTRLSSGYVRNWEGRYASGIIVGAYTRTNRIGVVVGQNSVVHAREIAATYMGARQVNPAVQFFVSHAGGFDNSTLQTKAATDLIENHSCDVLVTYVNPLTVQYIAKNRNLTSVFSGGDGRILAGESVLTSVVYSRAAVMVQLTQELLNKRANPSLPEVRIDYSGGYSDGAVSLSPFGTVYFDRPEIRGLVESTLSREIDRLRAGLNTGFCNVSALGLTPDTPEGCWSNTTILAWSWNFTTLQTVFTNITYLGTAEVELIEVYVRYSDPVAIAFVILAAITIAACVCLTVVTAYYSSIDHTALRYASPPFMFTVLGGATLLAIAIMTANMPLSNYCNATLWLVTLGLNTMYSAVFAKAGRFWWILRSAEKMRRVRVPNKILFLVLGLQLATVLIILIIGTSVAPYQRVLSARTTLPANSVLVYCAPSGGGKLIYWPITLVIYQSILAAVGLFFAFRTRNLFDEMNESRESALITYNLLFVGIVIIVLLYLVDLGPVPFYVIECVGILWITASTLTILFFPKCYEFITGRPFRDSLFNSRSGITSSGARPNRTPSARDEDYTSTKAEYSLRLDKTHELYSITSRTSPGIFQSEASKKRSSPSSSPVEEGKEVNQLESRKRKNKSPKIEAKQEKDDTPSLAPAESPHEPEQEKVEHATEDYDSSTGESLSEGQKKKRKKSQSKLKRQQSSASVKGQ